MSYFRDSDTPDGFVTQKSDILNFHEMLGPQEKEVLLGVNVAHVVVVVVVAAVLVVISTAKAELVGVRKPLSKVVVPVTGVTKTTRPN